MLCTSPVVLQDKDSGSVRSVPCGQCMACRVSRQEEWAMRIMHESRQWSDSVFVTLTYSPEFLPENGSLVKSDLQKFFKRFRFNIGKKCRYFSCGEYGDDRKRPHYHGIIFGVSVDDRDVIKRSWSFGLVHVGTLTYQSARYVAKYVQKRLTGPRSAEYQGLSPEFALMSRRPGIGREFAAKYVDRWLETGYTCFEGRRRPIPRCYLSGVDEKKMLDYRQQKITSAHDRLVLNSNIEQRPEWDILHQEVRERSQRDRNLSARLSLKKNKL